MWAASQTWGFEEGKPGVGLNGLLPAYAPPGLTEDDFNQFTDSIDDSWKDWSRETAGFVKDLYEGSHPTLADQQAAVQRVKVKVNTLEKALSDPRYSSISSQLKMLYGRLNPAVRLAEAMLNTLSMEPAEARQQRMQPAFAELQKAVDHLQADLAQYSNSTEWVRWSEINSLKGLKADDPAALETVAKVKAKLEAREGYSPVIKDFISREPFLQLEDALAAVLSASNEKGTFDATQLRESYAHLLDVLTQYQAQPTAELEADLRKTLDELRAKSPDGGVAVADALGSEYMNYNLRIVVSEGLVNRFFEETRTERSEIRERVMEANVYGYQCTEVTTKLDLVPNSLSASFALNLSGVIRSNANGYAPQATVHTVGYHTFNASKKVLFDGQNFYLENSRVSARANNQTVGATTKFSHVPILGRVANSIAIREANSRSPQTNAMAVQRIKEQVSTQLEKEAGEQFANASKQLQTKTYGPLRKYNLYPDVMTLSTTDSEMRFSSRLMDPDEIAGSTSAPIASLPANGMVAQVHESLLSHAFDRLGLNGKTMTEDEVRVLLESRLTEILGRPVEIPKPQNAAPEAEQQANTFVFDEKDPVRFTIDNGVVTLFIRAGLKRANGDDIPTQIISVPFTPTLQGDKILLTRGNVGVKPVVRPPNVTAQVARAQVMRQKIQTALPEQTVNAVFEVEQKGKVIKLAIVDLTAQGGWLVLALK
ncbi:hypothetical protein [Planctomicrobium piriforme]|nr:hypothetical protein [Planctomicrobium piriforme]